MNSDADSPIVRAQVAFEQLREAAGHLNSASDELGTIVTELDLSLKALNLGISEWVDIRRWRSEDGFHYSSRKLGYDKLDGKWGIAIKETWGNEANGDEEPNIWPFNDAPRGFRLKATEKLVDLIGALANKAKRTTIEVTRQTEEVRQVASAISAVDSQTESSPTKKRSAKRSRKVTGRPQ